MGTTTRLTPSHSASPCNQLTQAKIVHSFSSNEALSKGSKNSHANYPKNYTSTPVDSNSVSNGTPISINRSNKPLKFTDAIKMHDNLNSCKTNV